MRTSLIAVISYLAVATGAHAQEPPPSAAKLALAHKLIVALHAEEMVATLQETLNKSMLASLGKTLTASQKEKFALQQQASEEVTRTLTPKLLSFMEDLYARDFSEKELTDILAFYDSPTGRAALAKMPLIAQQVGPFVAQQMPRIIHDTLARYCAKTECTPEQKALLARPLPAA